MSLKSLLEPDRHWMKAALREAELALDDGVTLGGSIEDTDDGMTAFAWIVVVSADQVGRGRTATFFLPDEVARLVRGGMELGDADEACRRNLLGEGLPAAQDRGNRSRDSQTAGLAGRH